MIQLSFDKIDGVLRHEEILVWYFWPSADVKIPLKVYAIDNFTAKTKLKKKLKYHALPKKCAENYPEKKILKLSSV